MYILLHLSNREISANFHLVKQRSFEDCLLEIENTMFSILYNTVVATCAEFDDFSGIFIDAVEDAGLHCNLPKFN